MYGFSKSFLNAHNLGIERTSLMFETYRDLTRYKLIVKINALFRNQTMKISIDIFLPGFGTLDTGAITAAADFVCLINESSALESFGAGFVFNVASATDDSFGYISSCRRRSWS